MHPDELANWQIIKEKFEENGTTDNYFYKRACAIVSGLPDPMSNLPMSHRMDEIKPEHYVTEKQCQEMIDKAIDKHNKTATIISAILGSIVLGFYSHGLFALVGK